MDIRSRLKFLKKTLSDKDRLMLYLEYRGMIPRMSDEEFLRKKWRVEMGTELDLEHPRTFNEKLQWLKLYDRRPEYTTMVDKVAVKDYVANIIGKEHIIPTLGVWEDPDEIDFDALPDQFVLKCNHNSGTGMCICRDKSKLNVKKVKAGLRKGLKEDFYLINREWPYKNVPRKILAEQYMVDESGTELKDYKVFNFNGEPKFIEVDFDRFKKHKRNLYSIVWDQIEGEIEFPPDKERVIDTPKKLAEMLEIAEKLSAGIPHVRTDFYSVDDKIFFGELTFFHGSGYEKFRPDGLDLQLGSWVNIIYGGGVFLHKDNMFLHVTEAEETVSAAPRAEGLIDYKFYCFNGEPKFLYIGFANIINGRKNDLLTYLNLDWSAAPFYRTDYGNLEIVPEKPTNYDEMLSVATKLSQGIPFVRVDLYNISGQIYFSEITFSPGSGYGIFSPFRWERELGAWLYLPEKHEMQGDKQ